MKLPIYMDYQATTPCDPRVVDAMLPYFTEKFGNAASRSHAFGWEAEKAVDTARKQIASVINATPKEIIFTSGATECDNMALIGAARMYGDKGKHIITTDIEHKAILDTAAWLEKNGYSVTYVPAGKDGIVSVEDIAQAITDDTILISVMHANNEIGTIQPIADIGALAHDRGIVFHTDAAQSLGKLPIDVQEMNIDLMSMSGHKIYGPKGVGAMYVRRRKPRVRLAPLIHGGGHERGFRSGTLNVTGVVGMGAAVEIAGECMAEESARLTGLREKLWNALSDDLDEIYLNGHPTKRLPTNLNVSFAYVEGESLLMGLKNVALSSGSACTSASLEPSYVLRALGVTEDLAHTSLRFGLGRFTTEEEIDFVIKDVVGQVRRLREMSPLYEMAKEGIDISKVEWVEHGGIDLNQVYAGHQQAKEAS